MREVADPAMWEVADPERGQVLVNCKAKHALAEEIRRDRLSGAYKLSGTREMLSAVR